MVETRPATAEDTPRLSELHTELLASVDPIRGGPIWKAAEGAVAPPWTQGAPGAAQVIVATISAEVVGYAQFRAEDARGIIDTLYVTPDARTVGAGDALLRAVRATLTAAGCTRVDSYALPGDRDTKNFFESHAMVARLLVVSAELPAT